MKIAQVVSTFFPHYGGMGAVCEEEADALAEREHEVTVFTLRYPNFKYLPDFFLFNIERLTPWIKLGDAGLLPQLTKRLRAFDIIHLHYPFFGGAEWVWLAKKIYGKKYVITYHMQASPKGFLKRLIQRFYNLFWEQKILLGAEKILVVDKKYWDNLPVARKIPVEKIEELPNGINVKIFCPRQPDLIKEDLKEFADKKIILFVGNLLPLKRLDLLLNSLKNLSRTDWHLLIIGGGYAEVEYRQLAEKLDLNNQVTFAGYCLDRFRLAEYYSSAWVTVLPTDNESFSLVAVESLACGAPVILAAGSGGANRIKEGENGWLFSPGSVKDLSEKLNFVLDISKDKRAKIFNGYKIMSEYDWNNHITKLEKVYERI